jgi:hypothetical protein
MKTRGSQEPVIGHGKLAEQLTKSKIISPEVLKQLQDEWKKQYKEELKHDLISNRRKNNSSFSSNSVPIL